MANTNDYKFDHFNVTFPAEYVAHVEINRPDKLNAFFEQYVLPFPILSQSLYVYVCCESDYPQQIRNLLSVGLNDWPLLLLSFVIDFYQLPTSFHRAKETN